MNFTREPIIETVITPKDGFKLTIRNSKGGSQEEYSVDAIEVVSFGQSMFFRSQERPKSFLLPVTDYEVIEVKETRVVLKNAPLEGSIKIGGGKVVKPAPKEPEEKVAVAQVKPAEDNFDDRPRRRKSSSRRRRGDGEGSDHQHRPQGEQKQPRLVPPPVQNGESHEKKHEKPQVTGEQIEPFVSSTMFRNLIPPPPGLISEKLQQEKYHQAMKEATQPEVKEEKPLVEESKDSLNDHDDNSDGDSSGGQAHVEEKKEEAVERVEKKEEPIQKESPRYHQAPKVEEDRVFFKLESNFAF